MYAMICLNFKYFHVIIYFIFQSLFFGISYCVLVTSIVKRSCMLCGVTDKAMTLILDLLRTLLFDLHLVLEYRAITSLFIALSRYSGRIQNTLRIGKLFVNSCLFCKLVYHHRYLLLLSGSGISDADCVSSSFDFTVS